MRVAKVVMGRGGLTSQVTGSPMLPSGSSSQPSGRVLPSGVRAAICFRQRAGGLVNLAG
jgi:hypothetical protein